MLFNKVLRRSKYIALIELISSNLYDFLKEIRQNFIYA